jgi:hypothetical protein
MIVAAKFSTAATKAFDAQLLRDICRRREKSCFRESLAGKNFRNAPLIDAERGGEFYRRPSETV